MEKQFNPIDPTRNREREAAILTIDVCTQELVDHPFATRVIHSRDVVHIDFLRSSVRVKNISNFSMFENT